MLELMEVGYLMLNMLLVILALVCALLAVSAPRLIRAALWLAGVSALTAILLYRIGAHQAAVIELSVGAGLVTVLFVFAIAIAGEDAMAERPVVPRWLAISAALAVVVLAVWMVLPAGTGSEAVAEGDFATTLWQERGLDALVQVGLIFAGVIGVLGLLAPSPAREKAAETRATRGEEAVAAPASLAGQER
jgi:uncharacterized MnhB-related membrane protein